MKWTKYLVLFFGALFLGGCVNMVNMPLSNKQYNINLSSESIALVSVKISNKYKKDIQPDLTTVFLFSESKEGKDGKDFAVSVDVDPVRSEENEYKEYLLNFSLKPGTYTFGSITGTYSIPLFLHATCNIPMHTEFEIKPNEITYLGNIDAVLRKRIHDDEVRAGSLIPLLDQASAGFPSGTFDVVIKDKFEEDMALFLSEYPALGSFEISKSILPPWESPGE